MSFRFGVRRSGAWKFAAVVSALALSGPVAAAQATTGFMDFSYAPLDGVSPTGQKPESKLWFNNGWWATMFDPASQTHHIFRLDRSTERWVDTGVQVDPRPKSMADVLWDAASRKLYVVSHEFSDVASSSSSGRGRLWRFSYDAVRDTYTKDSGFPVDVNSAKTETLTVAKDSAGKLWATWTLGSQVYVNRSTTSDSSWGTPFVVPGAASLDPDDISSVIAFQGDKVGVMWSNQATKQFFFATHSDGAPDTTGWVANPVPIGSLTSDDHINLKTDAAGRIYAVVKHTATDPILSLLVRDADGTWHNYDAWKQSTNPTRPLVVLDEQHGIVHLFSTDQAGGPVHEKAAPMNAISFDPKPKGKVVLDSGGDLNDATSTKQNVSSSTGLIVMANDRDNNAYWHADVPLTGAGADLTPPPTPAGLVATAGDGQVTLDWADSTAPDIGGYRVYRCAADGSCSGSVLAAPTVSAFTDAGLTNGTVYRYRVTAYDTSANESALSALATATPRDLTPPAVPSGLAAVAHDRKVTLTWVNNAGSDAVGFRVYHCSAGGATCEATPVGSPTTATFTDTGLTNGTPVTYRVSALDAPGNESARSAAATATPIAQPPTKPLELTAAPEDGEVDLNWDASTDPDGTVAGYDVHRRVAGSATWPAAALATAAVSSSYKDPTATNGTAWEYRVVAVDDDGNRSEPSDPAAATPVAVPPSQPTGLVATAGDGEVAVDWADNPAVDDVTGYDVQRRESGAPEWPTTPLAHTTASSYDDRTAANGTAWEYRVIAVDDHDNDSVPSDPASATPVADPPAKPATPLGTPGDRHVDLTWTANGESDVTGYEVERCNADATACDETTAVATNAFGEGGLTNGTTDNYRVRAVDRAGNRSAYSDLVAVTPVDVLPPAAPAGLAAQAGDKKIDLTWTANTESDLVGYRVTRCNADASVCEPAVPVAVPSFEDTGLTNGTVYSYRVTALDDDGNASSPSVPLSATPIDPTPVDTTFTVVADGLVKSTAATKNYGADKTLRVRKGADAQDVFYRSYMRFRLTGLTGRVTGAKLRLSVTDPSKQPVDVFMVGDAWAELASAVTAGNPLLTWNSGPVLPATRTATGPVNVAANTIATIDLGATAVTGNGTYDIALAGTGTDSMIAISREGYAALTTTTQPKQADATPPRLIVTTVG